METLAAQPLEHTQFDKNKRDYDDLTTQFAEMINGSMRTPFEYGFDGHELYARDGSAMRTEFEKGLAEADMTAESNPNLSFEVRRRRWEIDEYYDMLKMAKSTLPNTMVVISDFPQELMDASRDVGGYNTGRKQSMLRVLAWDGTKMRMYSQSLDRSDRKALESIYGSLGFKAEPGELLAQRMHLELGSAEQHLLIDKLTNVYDASLQNKFGGTWFAGRAGTDRLNTYDFVKAQHDLIQLAMQQKRQGDLDIYAIAATLDARFHRNKDVRGSIIQEHYSTPFHNLQYEIYHETTRARIMKRVFSACGLTINALEPNIKDQLSEGGYGNKTDEETKYSFDKKMHCVVCQAPPKEGEAKKMCGPCGICRGCDAKLRKK